MAYFLRRAARSILGESRYGKLRPIAAYWREQTRGFVAEPAGGHSGEREASIEILGPAFDHIGPTQNELALLHLREVATTLSLGLQYSYNSWIEGDIVEFGTASGFTACAIAKAMVFCELSRPPKRLHLFDSFKGLPVATSAVDQDTYHVRRGFWREGACSGLSSAELFTACSRVLPGDRIVMHEGWFKDTVTTLPSTQRFAFIHFDGDLYQSTIDAIGHLFAEGLISNGAMICFDDWNCNQASPGHGERRAWRELTAQYGVTHSEWRSYSSMGKAFFIHDYRRDRE